MNEGWHIVGEILAVILLAFYQRQQHRTIRRLPEIITESLRPPRAPRIEFVCDHDELGRLISGRGMMWCSKCGALKVDGGPWRSAGDDDTPVTQRTRELRGGE